MTTTTERPADTAAEQPDGDEISTALATYDPAGGTQGVVVGGQVAAFKDFAQVLSASELLPDGLKGKPANVFMALMQGLDLGLRPMQALNLIDVIKGKPAMNAQGMRAQILAAGHRFRIVENTDERCVIAAHRKDWPDDEWPEASFTIEQAQKAGLSGDNWRKYPADMLLARATSRMAKAYFSDVTNGLSSVEELLDITPTATRSLAEVAQERRGAAAVDQPVEAEVGADGAPIVDAEIVPEPTDDEIRAAVLEQAGQGTTAVDADACPACGTVPRHDPSQCPMAGSVDATD